MRTHKQDRRQTTRRWALWSFGFVLLTASLLVSLPARSQTSRSSGATNTVGSVHPAPSPPAKLQSGSFRTVTTKHFTFQYPHRWSKWVKRLIQRSENDLKSIGESLGFLFQGHLRVRFASAGKDYAKIQPFPWHPPSYIAGLAYPRQGIMTIRLRGIDGFQQIHQTFRHELSHLLLAQAASHRPLPLWFIEGLAMVHSDDFGTLDRMWLLSTAQISGRWPTLSQIKKRFPNNYAARRVAYAVSFDFVAFLQQQSHKLIPSLLALMRRGIPFRKALQQQSHQSWEALQETWLSRSRLRYGWLSLLTQEGLIWFIAIVLLLVGYRKIKRRRRERLQTWEEEDNAEDAESPWYPPSASNSYPFPTDRP